MATDTYTEITINLAFRQLVDLIAVEVDERFSDVVETADQITYGGYATTDFDADLEEHFVPFDFRRIIGEEGESEGRCVRVRRGEDGDLQIDEKRYRDDADQLSADVVLRLLDAHDIDSLRALAVSAIEDATPHSEPIENAAFLEEHRAALMKLQQAADMNKPPTCSACGRAISGR